MDNSKIKKVDERFNTFWNNYPKKVSKAQAEKTFNGMMKHGITIEKILHCLKNYKKEIQETGKESQFIKNPSTFLNNYLDYENAVSIKNHPQPKETRCACGGTINPAGFCRACKKEFYTYEDDDE